MIIKNRFLTAALVASTVFAAACGKDSTAPNANLSAAQLSDMMAAMAASGFGFASTLPAAAASRGVAALVSLTVDQDVPCPVSGNVHVAGSFSVNDTWTQLTMNGTEKHQACAAVAKSGKTWTFDGKPNLTAGFTATMDPTTGAGSFTGTEKGAIGFATDGLSGQCTIDISISATTNAAGTTTGTITGTVCGKDVTQDFSGSAA